MLVISFVLLPQCVRQSLLLRFQNQLSFFRILPVPVGAFPLPLFALPLPAVPQAPLNLSSKFEILVQSGNFDQKSKNLNSLIVYFR